MLMEILRTMLLVLGTISIILLIIAVIVIVYDKKMTTLGRVRRIVEIIFFPTVGPIIVLLEVLYRNEKEKRAKEETRK